MLKTSILKLNHMISCCFKMFAINMLRSFSIILHMRALKIANKDLEKVIFLRNLLKLFYTFVMSCLVIIPYKNGIKYCKTAPNIVNTMGRLVLLLRRTRALCVASGYLTTTTTTPVVKALFYNLTT